MRLISVLEKQRKLVTGLPTVVGRGVMAIKINEVGKDLKTKLGKCILGKTLSPVKLMVYS